MKQVTIYTDGACSGNPGPGGWGRSVKKICRRHIFSSDHGGYAGMVTNCPIGADSKQVSE